MFRYLLYFLFFSFYFFTAHAEQNVPNVIDSAASENEPKYEYWRKDYYKDIKEIDQLVSPVNQDFSQMVRKYHSKEFEYVESISDKISIWNSIIAWIKNFLRDLFPQVRTDPGEWFYTLLGLAGGALVIFLLYKFFFSGKQFVINPKEEKDSAEEILDFVEKNLLDIDLHIYLKDALDTNNYPLAIRYQQLLNIQLLAKNNMIIWDQAKTNMELMDEIKAQDVRSDFKKCTALFDYVWFGHFEITTAKFEEITMQFQSFQRRWS